MFLILWLNEHRMLVVGFMGLSMWVGAYTWYFRHNIRNQLTRSKPHSWSVDMVSKKGMSRGKEQY
jgi:hypothetical protein